MTAMRAPIPAAIGFGAHGANLDPVAASGGVATKKLWKMVDAVDDDVDIAVVVEVAEGSSAGGSSVGYAGAALCGDLFELAVAEIAVEVFVLGVGRVDVGAFDLGVDMAVGHEDVEPAVVVHVEEAHAPAEEASVDAEAGDDRCGRRSCRRRG